MVQEAISSKAPSPVLYGRQVDLAFIEKTIDAKDNKAKNNRVQYNFSAT